MFLATPLAGMPFAREVGGLLQGYRPTFGGVGALFHYAYNVGRGATWDEDLDFMENVEDQSAYFWQQLARIAGLLTRMPAGQATATWRAFQAEAEGDQTSLREYLMGPDWEDE